MVMQYIESRDRSMLSGNAAEDIRPGNLVRLEGNEVYNATHSGGAYGIALGVGAAEWAADDPEDYRSGPPGDALAPFVYQPAANKTGFEADEEYDDTVPYAPFYENGQRIKVRLPEDPGDGSPAPDVSGRSVVGVIDEYPGRLVQEGYSADFTDDGTDNATTFNRDNDNFVPVGIARRNAPTTPVNEFHSLFHVITDDL